MLDVAALGVVDLRLYPEIPSAKVRDELDGRPLPPEGLILRGWIDAGVGVTTRLPQDDRAVMGPFHIDPIGHGKPRPASQRGTGE